MIIIRENGLKNFVVEYMYVDLVKKNNFSIMKRTNSHRTVATGLS
jgi:hypothetical protein